MDKDVIILLVNGFCVIVTVYCFVSDYYVIALVGMVSNFFLSFYKLIFGRYFFSIGIKAKNNKNYKKAINYFNKGFQVYPSFSGFLVNLGLIYFDLKDYEKAIVYFDKAIDGGDNNDWLYLKRFEAFYNLGRYYSARMSLNEDILKNPTPKWVMHGKVAMMMRFKGYPFYLIHDGHVKFHDLLMLEVIGHIINLKSLHIMSAWFILENLLNGIVDVNDVNIFLLEYLNRWRFKLF